MGTGNFKEVALGLLLSFVKRPYISKLPSQIEI